MSVNNNASRTIDGQNTLFCDTIEINEEIILNGDNGIANAIIKSDGINARWATLGSLLTEGTGIDISGTTISTSNVPNSSLANSTISSKALGTNLDTLTINGTEGSITYNGSAAATLTINDANTTYTAGTGLTLSAGDEFSTTAIPNSSLSNSTISGHSLGTNLNDLTAGTNIVMASIDGLETTYNGSKAITIASANTEYTAGTGLTLSAGDEFSTTAIPNSSLDNSTISGHSLGTNLDNLSVNGTTYNGSSSVSITTPNTEYTAGSGLDLSGTEFTTTNSALEDRGATDITIGESTLMGGHQQIRIGRGGDHRVIIDSSSTTTIGGDVIEIILDPHGSNQHLILTHLPTSSFSLPTGCVYNDAGTLKIV